MKYLILLLVLGASATWPEGRPNCPVAGEWGVPGGSREVLTALVEEESGETSTVNVSYNSTNEHYLGAASAEDDKVVTLKVEGSENNTLLLHLMCLNEALWVLVTPLKDSPRMMKMMKMAPFKRRLPPTPFGDTPSSPSTPSLPEFILVNISLPRIPKEDHKQDNLTVLPEGALPPLAEPSAVPPTTPPPPPAGFM